MFLHQVFLLEVLRSTLMHSSGNACRIPEKQKSRMNSSASNISTKAKAFGGERNDSDIEQL